MTGGLIDQTRESGNMTPRKQYFMIYEGQRTEPDYFAGIRRCKDDFGIENLIDIGRSGAYWHTTDILILIDLAESYAKTIQKKRFHVDYFMRQYFEPHCMFVKDNIQCIKGTFGMHLSLVQTVMEELHSKFKEKQWIDDEGLITDGHVANVREECSIALKIIEKQISPDIYSKYVKYCDENHPRFVNYNNNTVRDGDSVCIVHDRDHHEFYFPNEMYDRAREKIIELRGALDYRLVITYPKFEFWLLLHKDLRWDIQRMKNYPGAGNYCQDRYDEAFYNGKKIDEDTFDVYFKDNIFKAIAESKKYSTDVNALRDNVGTNVGLLLEEMMEDTRD